MEAADMHAITNFYFLSAFSTLYHACVLYLYKNVCIYQNREEASTSFGQCKRMEHIYQFQHWLFFIGLVMLLSLALSVKANELEGSNDRRGIALNTRSFISISKNRTALSRKLLLSPDIGDGTKRIGQDCSKDDIVLFQGSTNPLPSGVPAYTVEIFNACVSDCNIAEIHVSCGWFSSVRLVNPRVFRRLCYDDCLVNDGQPLGPGQTLSFNLNNRYMKREGSGSNVMYQWNNVANVIDECVQNYSHEGGSNAQCSYT